MEGLYLEDQSKDTLLFIDRLSFDIDLWELKNKTIALNNRASNLATRLFIGVGHAYGNSENLPYIKQFASGGSNSIHAFPARSIGPGTYNVRTDTTI